MFGFYSFSENPFSSASLVSAGEVKTGVAVLSASGNFDSNGAIIHGAIAAPNASGELISDSTILYGGFATLEASGSLTSSDSVAAAGSSLLLDAGTVTANGTLALTSDSSLQASGEISGQSSFAKLGAANISVSGSIVSDNSLIITGDGTLTGSGEFTPAGKVFKTSSAQISSSGTLGSIGTFNKITGGSNLESPGATIIAGKFAPGELTASLSASSSITAQIGLDLESQATVGKTVKEFITKTSRPNYKPALPKLSNKGIVLDFPFYEGAGPYIHNVSSRAQKAALNGLEPMWQREDGIQSLYSPGTTFDNYRITTETTGITFDRAGIVLRFKPTRNTTGREFLFTIRGTANNNNEIDCYTRTANGKVYIKIYNGTSEQALQIPNLVLDQWNTLVVTWGGGDLKGSLNGNEFSTYSSVTVPHATLVGKTLYLYGTSSDTLIPQGYIGAFRWYNRELSIVEVKQLHKNIYKDYSLDYIIPNHHEMSRVTSAGRLMKNSASNISASGQVISRGSFILAQLKAAIGGQGLVTADGIVTDFDTSTISLQAAATIAANGIVLGELDIVPFTMLINQLEDYNIDVYRTFVKEFNMARSKAISASIEKTKITDINIDKILDTGLEK